MAFFKFRKGGDESPAASVPPESVEVLRRRARHRLIGAAVLVLLGVIGFPLLFDTQPRPVAVDIPIEIPDRNKAKPLAAPAPSPARAETKASEPVRAAAPPAEVASKQPAPALAPTPAAPPAVIAKPETRVQAVEAPSAPAAKAAVPARTEQAAKPAARPQAPMEGRPVKAAAQEAADGRFVVQVGAFADAAKARDIRSKVEKAGLKTYTHVTETGEGKRIRVRVGPFASRADADKAAGKIKDLDLPAKVLSL